MGMRGEQLEMYRGKSSNDGNKLSYMVLVTPLLSEVNIAENTLLVVVSVTGNVSVISQ